MTTKQQIRKKMRRRRQNLGPYMRKYLANQFTEHFLKTALFRNSKRIGCYLPNDGEMDLESVIRQIWKMNKECYLPVLSRHRFQQLNFAPFTPHTNLKKNKYGIPEPVAPVRQAFQAQNMDLILIPLVAFDQEGNRIGMGGGFYDRSLAFINHREKWLKPDIFGVAYEFQQVSQIKRDKWDVPMHGVLTEIKQYNYIQTGKI